MVNIALYFHNQLLSTIYALYKIIHCLQFSTGSLDNCDHGFWCFWHCFLGICIYHASRNYYSMLVHVKAVSTQPNEQWTKLYRSRKSKIYHLKRLEVTGQGEILSSQDFYCGCRSTYSTCVCDTPTQLRGKQSVSNFKSDLHLPDVPGFFELIWIVSVGVCVCGRGCMCIIIVSLCNLILNNNCFSSSIIGVKGFTEKMSKRFEVILLWKVHNREVTSQIPVFSVVPGGDRTLS